jgi:ABC transporter DrrB family efflux protein
MSLVSDSLVVVRRNTIKIRRVPDLLVFATLSPIMFVLLFRYVFGSAIPLQGISYAEFLLPGILAQTVIFGSTTTGSAMADDMQKGLIDRFRSLPMSRSAVLVGRTVSDQVLNAVSIVVMLLTGLVVGWRPHTSVPEFVLGIVVLLAFAFAISWMMALVGLLVRTPEVVNNASFIVIFPLTFIANTFVPIEGFPTPLRIFAEWNPVSAVTQAARDLFGNTVPGAPEPDVWALANPTVYTLIWVVILLGVFVPLAVRQYERAASR